MKPITISDSENYKNFIPVKILYSFQAFIS